MEPFLSYGTECISDSLPLSFFAKCNLCSEKGGKGGGRRKGSLNLFLSLPPSSRGGGVSLLSSFLLASINWNLCPSREGGEGNVALRGSGRERASSFYSENCQEWCRCWSTPLRNKKVVPRCSYFCSRVGRGNGRSSHILRKREELFLSPTSTIPFFREPFSFVFTLTPRPPIPPLPSPVPKLIALNERRRERGEKEDGTGRVSTVKSKSCPMHI